MENRSKVSKTRIPVSVAAWKLLSPASTCWSRSGTSARFNLQLPVHYGISSGPTPQLKPVRRLRAGNWVKVLVPILYPLSWQHPSDAVKLGRATEWQELQPGMPVPVGQKMLIVDGEEVIPLLEVRDLQFPAVQDASTNAASS